MIDLTPNDRASVRCVVSVLSQEADECDSVALADYWRDLARSINARVGDDDEADDDEEADPVELLDPMTARVTALLVANGSKAIARRERNHRIVDVYPGKPASEAA